MWYRDATFDGGGSGGWTIGDEGKCCLAGGVL